MRPEDVLEQLEVLARSTGEAEDVFEFLSRLSARPDAAELRDLLVIRGAQAILEDTRRN